MKYYVNFLTNEEYEAQCAKEAQLPSADGYARFGTPSKWSDVVYHLRHKSDGTVRTVAVAPGTPHRSFRERVNRANRLLRFLRRDQTVDETTR